MPPPDQQSEDTPSPSPRSRRWRLAVVGVVVLAAIVIAVVVTQSSTSEKPADGGPVSGHLIRAGDIGNVKDALALREIVEPALRGTSATKASGPSPRCTAEARKLQPSGATLTYEAAALWQGTPAEVFGFSPPGAPATSSPSRPPPTRVYVLSRAECQLLVFQSYAP